MICRLALFLLLLTGAAMAQAQTAAEAAEAALARLSAAGDQLEAAESASDRVAALTETVRAYEDGLAAVRDGLRQVAIRERSLATDLASREDEVSELLGVLSSISAAPRPLLLLHPSGPAGTARAAMLLSELTPSLQLEARQLSAQLAEIHRLQGLQEGAAATLTEGLSGAQAAREALSVAMSDRTDLPRRFAQDEVAMAVLIASTETLAEFALGLDGASGMELGGPIPDATGLRGALALPVDGVVIRRAGQPDAAGIARPGWIVATPPQALVTAPVAATLRYRGPLLDLGEVVILEPANGTLFVFAGLARSYGEIGEVLAGGAAVGLMGGSTPDVQGILTESAAGAGASRSETLYIEVREADTTVDPATWFGVE